MTKTIRCIDTTLREGEQAPGVSFSLSHKQQIVNRLVAVGIHEVELGIASPLVRDLSPLVNWCRKKYPLHRFSLWSRCVESDIRYAARLGIEIVSLSIPVSDLHLDCKLQKSREWARQTLARSIRAAKSLGLTVAVGFEDATRADESFLLEMALLARHCGAVRVRLADTVGICTPLKLSSLVAMLLEQLSGAEVGVHTHNDFGMAMGNAVAAAESGAAWLDGAVLGLGERAGCAPLEQLVGYLVLGRGEQGLCVEQLKSLVEFVAGITGSRVDSRSPIFGEAIFTCETGLHLQGLMQKPETYEPFAPDAVGTKRKLLIGAKAGKAAIVRHLQLQGCEPMSDAVLDRYVKAVRAAATRLGRALNSEEILAVCTQGLHLNP